MYQFFIEHSCIQYIDSQDTDVQYTKIQHDVQGHADAYYNDAFRSDRQKKCVTITGADVNHIKNVLRMHPGEKIAVIDKADGKKYICEIQKIEESVTAVVLEEEEENTELPAEIYLFQGLPKADKMEWLIQKAVELGCFEIIPVTCRRCIVKLDEKKKESRKKRWQGIAEAAAKQSRRRIIPEVHDVMSLPEALSYAKDMDLKIIPYELAEGMAETRALISAITAGQRIAVFIGPEGGFEESEIEQAMAAGVLPVTLGKRILRTETAGLTVLSWLMYFLEK